MNETENPYNATESSAVETETDTHVGTVVSVEVLQDMTSDIVHANLFGSFLICGTPVGIALFRRFVK